MSVLEPTTAKYIETELSVRTRLRFFTAPLHVTERARSTRLEDDAFVYRELGDDVREQQVTVVLGGRVHAVLTHQARPGERHQPTQLVTLWIERDRATVRRGG